MRHVVQPCLARQRADSGTQLQLYPSYASSFVCAGPKATYRQSLAAVASATAPNSARLPAAPLAQLGPLQVSPSRLLKA